MIDNFFMCYQPIFFMHRTEENLKIIGYEALLRHPDGRTPLQILSDARSSNVLAKLEMEIFKTAVNRVLFHSPHMLFVNITADTYTDAAFAVKARRVLQGMGVSPTRVCIEVSEQNLYHPDEFRESLTNWVNLGFYVALDDFGSMGSNIDIVLAAKPDYVKVDKVLICDVHRDERKQRFLTGLIETLAVSGIYPIMEGIEEQRDLDWLFSKGWDIGGQGYALMVPSIILAS